MINETYSKKCFCGQSLVDHDPKGFGGIIKGSNFAQEIPQGQAYAMVQVFPDDMTGVTFKACNLDNVLIPPGNTVMEDCSHRKIQVQNDLEDWVLDDLDEPVEPVAINVFVREGVSTNPQDIPAQKLDESITKTKRRERLGHIG